MNLTNEQLREPIEHRLKTWPEYYSAVVSGEKTFEVRANDRDFRVGDTLVLEEYDPTRGEYTGQRISRKVTYLLDSENFCKAGTVVLGLESADNAQLRQRAEESREVAQKAVVSGRNMRWLRNSKLD